MASNCSVYNAKMKINCWYGTSTGRAFSLAHVQQSWNHETITWTNKPTSFTTVASNVERLSDNSVNFSGEAVNRMVQYWYTNGNNHGCSISYTNESKINPDYNAFYSSNCDVSYNVKRPLLSFSYVQPENLPDGIYFMGNRNSKMVMDVLHAGGPGAQVVQFTYHGNTNQYWFFTRQSDGSYMITPTYNTNLALEVKGGGTGNNKLVQVNTKTGASNQRWFIYDNMNDYYRIMSKCSYQCQGLRPQDGSTTERAPIVQYDLYGYPSSWEITPPEYGNGGAYRQVNTSTPNCFGYAMFVDEVNINKLFWPSSHKSEDFSDKFAGAINGTGKTCRRISSFTSPIESNEYRVAIRVPNLLDGIHQYHVIYQLSDGTWAGKDDKAPSQHFGYDNPSTTGVMWSNDAYSPSAGTIYFAVKR